MTDIKHIVAGNITQLRVSRKMTQLELAEQLNYSDKAVSKWERGDSMPDVAVLAEIAGIFGVTLDYLIQAEHPAPEPEPTPPAAAPASRHNHWVIVAVSVLLVWFIALLVYVVVSSFVPHGGQWMAFIYAIPVSSIVWLVFNSVWFNPRFNYVIISLLMWSCILALHLTLLLCHVQLALLYLLGIPGQLAIILWSMIRKRPAGQPAEAE